MRPGAYRMGKLPKWACPVAANRAAHVFDGGYIIKVSETYVNSFKIFPIWKFIIDDEQDIAYNNGVESIRLRHKESGMMHRRHKHGKDNKIQAAPEL